MPTILYLSFNDGSDMRITKEVRTLSHYAAVELVAVGTDPSLCYAAAYAHKLHYIPGARASTGTLLRYFLRCAWLLLTRRYHSVHIINEPQLMVLWPLLWFQKQVVLDIFDSIFLRKNRPGNQVLWLKKLVYAPIHRAIVTDENRLTLLPDFLKKKAHIVPNYPYTLSALPPKVRTSGLTIMYYGWLGEQRGTATARNLLAADPNVRLLMAGWLADEPSRTLTQHPQVEWLGVLPQAEALQLAARRADYILCVYAPINANNINASPNKIYDAIQTRTPVIINAEVQVARWVQQHRLGHVLPQYAPINYPQLAQELQTQREAYTFDESLRRNCTWETAESELVNAHGFLQA
ncbi:hypothetical protein GCM10027275_30070 [Rhabdobacter roseus]|uniref:Glycosyltransferase n=1 Tax=Rhabdobacter roseus TaxID=1655419 RepID=A0A840TNM7_9BACT|nr:hypothetical protein [Rhabdobacter roseus]MBB5284964.1 hypothetical protein [Rhabdobacter roseus]